MRCVLDPGETLGSTRGARFTHLALGPRGEAFASSAEGLRRFRSGEAPESLGPSCDGGLAVHLRRGLVWVLCLTRPFEAKDEPGVLTLRALPAPGGSDAPPRFTFAAGGADSAGVALDAHPAGGLALAWHDAGRVFAARLAVDGDPGQGAGGNGPELETELVSASTARAGAPRLLRVGERTLLTYGEAWRDAAGEAGRVLVKDLAGGLPQEVARVRGDARPAPDLTRDERGLVVIYREHRPGRKTALYARRLDDDLRPKAQARRVARADGEGRPSALVCGGSLITVTPRSWGQARIIGARVLDATLRDRLPERQLYEWDARFDAVAARCEHDTVSLLVAERSLPGEAPATLQRLALRCRAP